MDSVDLTVRTRKRGQPPESARRRVRAGREQDPSPFLSLPWAEPQPSSAELSRFLSGLSRACQGRLADRAESLSNLKVSLGWRRRPGW